MLADCCCCTVRQEINGGERNRSKIRKGKISSGESQLKGTVSPDVRPFFGQDSTQAPYERTGKNGFAMLENRKLAQSLTTHTRTIFFSYGGFYILNCCNWVCKLMQIHFFSHDCPFKICEKPSKFSESVRVVLFVSSCVVNNTQFSKISNYIFITFFISLFLFQSKIIYCVSAQSLKLKNKSNILDLSKFQC